MGSAWKPVVLVVEDEPLIRDVLALELSDHGFHVLEAEDGEVAIEILSSESPIDLLVTDIRLPGSHDGWSVARAAREHRPTVPVIYATGYAADVPVLVEGARLLRKPFLPATLIETAKVLGVSPR